jgi:hypothetical protein
MPDQTDLSGFDRLPAEIFAQLTNALMDIGTDLEGQGRLRAPIDKGLLRQSVHNEGLYRVAQAQGTANRLVVRVAARTPYAKIQHERTDFKHPRGGEAKYLEKPLAERLERYKARLSEGIRTALRNVST